ncbi:MAG TPA: helix-hairpin-helix domain-containing protein, partial [Balneolaceae bacterium]|nr:helix-hairpin-helix domain-containing protein [Balneolaceae bacterium]
GIGNARLAEIKPLIILGKVKKKAKKTLSSRNNSVKKVQKHSGKTKQVDASERINVNTADAKALATLPGIGPVYSHNIIDYRRKHGLFTAFKDLLKVKGIGKKRLESLKPFIKLRGETELE